jgi:hypothetical protein
MPTQSATLWNMARTAARAAGQFAASAGQTVDAAVQRERSDLCAACPHLEGSRCRQCGCFIAVKTWLPQEACPLEKWNRQST